MNSSISANNEYDLQEVIQQYQSQPELLKLILTSKVEEDKRRAEEAKLRAKELDLYLQQPPSPRRSPSPDVIKQEDQKKTSYKVLPSLSTKKTRTASASAPYCIPQVLSPTYFNIQPRSFHSSISSTSSMSSLSEEEDDDETDQHQQRRHSAAAAMLAMGGSLVNKSQEKEQDDVTSAYPSPVADYSSDEISNKPRRRREMQAITKIVETREFPYIDDYFWKNNGNTVQKKTGCKSIYYKCSNSNKGCSVNKTVTAKPNGEYLIKYRGCHLQECGRVERIRDL